EEAVIYRLHDLTYSYARANTYFEAPAIIAACRRYLAAQGDSLTGIDADRANLLKAAEAAAANNDDASVIGLMHTLTVKYDLIRARGHDALLRNALDLAIQAARRRVDDSSDDFATDQRAVLHYLLGKRGDTHYERGEHDAALSLYNESLALARALNIPDREGLLQCVIGRMYADLQDFDAAEQVLNAAAEIATRTADDNLQARVLEGQGYLYAVAKGDFAAARAVFAQQVALAERLDNPERLVFALINLGSADHELGEFAAALVSLARALALSREQNNLTWIAFTLNNIGLVHDDQGYRDQAQIAFDEALVLYERAGLTTRQQALISHMQGAGYTIP
ncbi:MAG: tetratricopeptide repeat protein, partial [Anaerolineae bacterium]|nr:tetratricopeptide repeat protein [Anaerolineae bacterium]